MMRGSVALTKVPEVMCGRRPRSKENLAGGFLLLFTCLATVLALWHWAEGAISMNTVSAPRVEAFYWVAIAFSQTLGTALGDWLADTGGLGYEGGALVFGAGLALVAVLYF